MTPALVLDHLAPPVIIYMSDTESSSKSPEGNRKRNSPRGGGSGVYDFTDLARGTVLRANFDQTISVVQHSTKAALKEG